jgi:hypothetical protein
MGNSRRSFGEVVFFQKFQVFIALNILTKGKKTSKKEQKIHYFNYHRN